MLPSLARLALDTEANNDREPEVEEPLNFEIFSKELLEFGAKTDRNLLMPVMVRLPRMLIFDESSTKVLLTKLEEGFQPLFAYENETLVIDISIWYEGMWVTIEKLTRDSNSLFSSQGDKNIAAIFGPAIHTGSNSDLDTESTRKQTENQLNYATDVHTELLIQHTARASYYHRLGYA